jgi:hypothetical protein
VRRIGVAIHTVAGGMWLRFLVEQGGRLRPDTLALTGDTSVQIRPMDKRAYAPAVSLGVAKEAQGWHESRSESGTTGVLTEEYAFPSGEANTTDLPNKRELKYDG